MPKPVNMGGAEVPIRLVAGGQPVEERLQIGLLGMCGTVGQLHEPGPQCPVPLAGFLGAPGKDAFIIAGSDPGSRGEPRRRPKTTHISANLGDEHFRPAPVNAWYPIG
jgi:hypothetical protein